MPGFFDHLQSELDKLKDARTLKVERVLESPQDAHVRVDGRDVLMLTSNNYLGFANHPRIREAQKRAIDRWGAGNVRALNVRSVDDPAGALREALGGGADVVLELSGAEPSINLGLEAIYPGGWMSLLGLPKGNAVTLHHYSRDLIYKGVTLKAIIGRQVFATWVKMLDLLKAGLKVDDFVSHEFEGLDRFHEAQELLADREAMKVVFYPNGRPS